MIDDLVVHVLDDEEPSRKSLAFLLTAAGFTVRTHAKASAFLSIAPDIRRGCLVTDLRMPEMSGVELLRKLKEAEATLPAIVITGHGDVPMAVEAMKAGAFDFIEKPFEDAVLIDAIRRSAESRWGDKRASAADFGNIQSRLDLLTDRESQVLTAVVAGLSNKAIAYQLNISPRTVEIHRANVMNKMQASNLPELVRMALAANFGSS